MVLVVFFEILAIKRTVNEKYWKYLWALPIVNTVRAIAYIY
jgi:hypothetical protein